jgi:hypothetical protein
LLRQTQGPKNIHKVGAGSAFFQIISCFINEFKTMCEKPKYRFSERAKIWHAGKFEQGQFNTTSFSLILLL